MEITNTLYVTDREEWRRWLAQHHATEPDVWLVYYRKESGKPRLAYNDAVDEALCFGWIDSLVKRLDENRYAIKVTPRKPTSKWSQKNRRRWVELEAAGLLAPAGLVAAPTKSTYGPRPIVPALPNYIAIALKANPQAWKCFCQLAPSHRRNYVVWIHTAKLPETRARRIQESIGLLTAGKKLGLK